MRKGIIATVGMIGALVLLCVGFLGPWYVIDATGIMGADYHARLFLTKMELQAQGQSIFVSMGYAEAKTYAQNMNLNMESFGMIDTALYLTLLALLTGVLAVVFMSAFVFEKGKARMVKLAGGSCAFLTFLLTLLPALYFMNTEFVENSGGFWFTLSLFGLKVSGGPGYAWYLMIVVAIISVVCGGAILLKKVPVSVISVGVEEKLTNEDE